MVLMLNFYLQNQETLITLCISCAALLISFIALYYTIKAFLLKAGHKIRGSFSITSTIESNDSYVFSVTLENIKDRATVIFSIYLKIGSNIYLLLEEFEQNPLILKSFEVYYKEFDPILFHTVGMNQVRIGKALYDNKIKKRIVLSTTDGKYIVKLNTKRWSPSPKFFRNHFTAIVEPRRVDYRGKSYGYNVKYLIVFKNEGKDDAVIAISESDIRIKKFANFKLTVQSLSSKDNLRDYLLDQKEQNNIYFEQFEIIDFENHVNKIKNNYSETARILMPYNYFVYNILGRMVTILSNQWFKRNRK